MGDAPKDAAGPSGGWRVIASEELADYEVFRVRRDRKVSPRTGRPFDFHLIDLADWVTVVAPTADGRLVMVEQVRHGTGTRTLEFPSGTLEAGEDPRDGARRELEEETGYRAAEYRVIAEFLPNPALQSNRMYVVLAERPEPDGKTAQDDGEDVEVRLVGTAEVAGLIDSGAIDHAMAILAWSFYERRGSRP